MLKDRVNKMAYRDNVTLAGPEIIDLATRQLIDRRQLLREVSGMARLYFELLHPDLDDFLRAPSPLEPMILGLDLNWTDHQICMAITGRYGFSLQDVDPYTELYYLLASLPTTVRYNQPVNFKTGTLTLGQVVDLSLADFNQLTSVTDQEELEDLYQNRVPYLLG